MKTYLYISLVSFLTFTLGSCSEWLDVQPKTEVKQDRMFESESGFKDALIGCYMLMGETPLYGQELTCTFLEVLPNNMILSILSTLISKLNYILTPPPVLKAKSATFGAKHTA